MKLKSALLGALSVLVTLGAASAAAASFDFVALGDTAYNGEADYPGYGALIDHINQARPAFSIHVGDVWGATACQEADHRKILGFFMRFEQPLIYTPGDNDWTDCFDPQVLAAWERIDEKKAQPGDEQRVAEYMQLSSRADRPSRWALESLARIRSLFFARPDSLGRSTLALTRQPAVTTAHAQMVENARWERDGVLFATVHVVGSMNGLSVANAESAAEAVRRNQANVAWIQQAFAEAQRSDAKAVVLAMQASLFERGPMRNQSTGRSVLGGRSGPFGLLAAALQDGAAEFGKPVLLIHGDDHEFMIDRPFFTRSADDSATKGGNLTRLQVYGSPEIRAVRIGVDTSTPWVFSFSPLFVQ